MPVNADDFAQRVKSIALAEFLVPWIDAFETWVRGWLVSDDPNPNELESSLLRRVLEQVGVQNDSCETDQEDYIDVEDSWFCFEDDLNQERDCSSTNPLEYAGLALCGSIILLVLAIGFCLFRSKAK